MFVVVHLMLMGTTNIFFLFGAKLSIPHLDFLSHKEFLLRQYTTFKNLEQVQLAEALKCYYVYEFHIMYLFKMLSFLIS